LAQGNLLGKAVLVTMDTTARTTPIREVDLGDQAGFTDSRALTETLAAPLRPSGGMVREGCR